MEQALENLKLMRDVFSDYQKENKILEAYIQNVNLYRKENKLVLEITSNLFVPIHLLLLECQLRLNNEFLFLFFQLKNVLLKIFQSTRYL